MRNFTAIILGVTLIWVSHAKADPPDGDTIYDPNPNHLWNRLNKTLFERTTPDGQQFGLGELDILYWYRTTNLLTAASHQRALAILDDFAKLHGERLIQDPLKKALLQRDLWALFDWVADPAPFYQAKYPTGRRELASRLDVVIRRLALTTNEIASLPDNYALAEKNNLPELPHGLFDKKSDWIEVGINGGEPAAAAHVRGFGGRSVFIVMFHDAAGRQAGLDYLDQLRAFKPIFIYPTNSDFPNQPDLNPVLPQFPTNSRWALVRRMCVIDTEGQIQATHVVESIQMRTYLNFDRFFGGTATATNPPQYVNEFRISRNTQARLISIGQNDRGFVRNNNFFSMGIDPFEFHSESETNQGSTQYQVIVLKDCASCHSGPGISSVNTFTRALSDPTPPSMTQIANSSADREAQMTEDWKERQFEWGLLQGLWMQGN
jgi:hypothetical protein